MEYMTSAEIREKYLAFFESKGCKRVPSSSLIPEDPSLLLTSAGMVQFKPYFLQQKQLEKPFIGTTTVQKCVRTNDIDIIGTTGRHLSFFEMLGNFAFGAYSKEDMCKWALEFSLDVLGLPFEKLYFTVFEDDDETIDIWKSLGVPDDHISRLGADDNFWRAGPTGPCGPCSELYFDQGSEVGCGKPDCKPGCECDRFLEYWNCVFTQYDGQEDGSLVPLPKKNIDTGMGLERMAAIMQGVDNNYDTDILRDLITVGEDLSHKTYKTDADVDLSLRIIADHSRAVTFMIADGILPSNEGRGYVLRRLLRRAAMKGHSLGIEGPFLSHYIEKITELMGAVYPELIDNKELIMRVTQSEEERFGATMSTGYVYLNEALDNLEDNVLSGDTAFVLHDTYGFPYEITQEICDQRGITIDADRFAQCMEEQRERARNANVKDAEAAWSTYGGIHAEILSEVGPSTFVGYDQAETQSRIQALVADGKRVTELTEGTIGEIILDITPFYANMGGEVGDTGVIFSGSAQAKVTDTQAPEKGLYCHTVQVLSGTLRQDDIVSVAIDAKRRAAITRNHTATHLLHASLREVLGSHVKQAGSYVGPDRLRFDFTHFDALSPEEIREVERIANDQVMEARPTNIYETSLTEARNAGVTALFGEKYGDQVRVVEVGSFSQELCGGCHVNNTAEIGLIKIISESSVGANLRRIEAVTSYGALDYLNRLEDELKSAAQVLKTKPFDVSSRALSMTEQVKELNGKLKESTKAASQDTIPSNFEEFVINGEYPIFIFRKDGLDASAMRNFWDMVRTRLPKPGAAVLASDNGGVPILLAAGSDEAVAAGFNAGNVIKAIAPAIKGGGGGKPTMAQAGGKDVNGLDAALDAARELFA